MRILFFGDIVGHFGLEAVSGVLSKCIRVLHADFVIANGENVSKGKGLTYHDYQALIDMGVDVVTLGNHYLSKNEILDYAGQVTSLVRPLNLKGEFPGSGSSIFNINGVEIQVTNILGEAFMNEEVNSPIETFAELLEKHHADIHIVDYHGESTSEKQTFAAYFDGQISACVGTHTHVQTNDAKIMPYGTAFIADAGFSGGLQSIIGFDVDSVINKIVLGNEGRFKVPDEGDTEVDFVIIDIDEETGLANHIEPIRLINGKEVVHGSHNL